MSKIQLTIYVLYVNLLIWKTNYDIIKGAEPIIQRDAEKQEIFKQVFVQDSEWEDSQETGVRQHKVPARWLQEDDPWVAGTRLYL